MESRIRTKNKIRISLIFVRIIEKNAQNLQNYLYISPLKKKDIKLVVKRYKILLNNEL
jgi:hypothetical protein